MLELKWLDQYTGQTTDELLSLENEYRIDSIILAFQEGLFKKLMRIGPEKLTSEENIIIAIGALEREVNNGGYLQFFDNSSKAFCPFIVEALEQIGCSEVAKLTQQAIDLLGIEEPVTIADVAAVMEKEDEELEDKLNECDDEYYKIAGDLSIPLLNYIKNNKHKIVLVDGYVPKRM